MPDKRIALAQAPIKESDFRSLRELVANGVTVLVGSAIRTAARRGHGGRAGAIALQLDVTDRVSNYRSAERVHKEFAARPAGSKRGCLRIPERAACPFRSTPR